MRIENDTLYFKSSMEYYTFEKTGIKPNTVRMLSPSEYGELEDWMGHPDRPIFISIESPTHKESFIREIEYFSDLGSILGSHLVIFCWRHPE